MIRSMRFSKRLLEETLLPFLLPSFHLPHSWSSTPLHNNDLHIHASSFSPHLLNSSPFSTSQHPQPLTRPLNMATEQPFEDEFSKGNPEYLVQTAISYALNRPFPVITNEEATAWAELAQSPINDTHQQEATETTGTKRKSDSPDVEDAPKPKTRRRKGDPEPDYSCITREVLKNNKRTGQACDRCKVRPATDPYAASPLLLDHSTQPYNMEC